MEWGFFILDKCMKYKSNINIYNNTLINSALQSHKNGDLKIAENLYLEILKNENKNSEALHLLGVIYLQKKEYKKALKLIETAIKINSKLPIYYINKGNALKGINNYIGAIECYRKALIIKPNLAEGYYNLANVQLKLNRTNDCINNIKKAIKINPNMIEAYLTISNALHQQGKYSEALYYQDIAIKLKPTYAEAYNNKGNTLERLGRYEEALSFYMSALKNNINYVEVYNNIGIIHKLLGNKKEALNNFQKAIRIDSNYAEVYTNIGVILQEEKKLHLAMKFYNKSLEIKPNNSLVISNLASLLARLGKYDEAISHYEQAIQLDLNNPNLYSNLGSILHQVGRAQESKSYQDKALLINPNSLEYQWERAMCEIVSTFPSDHSPINSIDKFEKQLNNIEEITKKNKYIDNYENIVGKNQPYHIAYMNTDNKKVLQKYGNLCCEIMSKGSKPLIENVLEKKHDNSKIRIGIVSSHIKYHSIWNAFLKGIVTQIDKNKFELYIYYLEGDADEETTIASNYSAKFISGTRSLKQWANLIVNDNLDTIIYPEIGMNKITTQLACLRLAKIQCTSWGHPETTGLPTIDYFISAEYTEELGSEDKYSEKLLKLDNLGCYFEPPSLNLAEYNFKENSINTNSKIFLCLGYSNKYHPDNDDVFIILAKKFTDYQFVFIKDIWGQYKILEDRLNKKFHKNNLNSSNSIKFIPYPTRDGFNTLMRNSRLLLDTIYFSHFNTSMQALGNTLPVVTIKGRFMRARATSGMLKMIGINELIALDKSTYINTIIRLTEDDDYYNLIKKNIINNVNLLYKDILPIRTLEKFFIEKLNS